MERVFLQVSHVCLVKTFQVFHSALLLLYVFRSVGHANTVSQIDISNKKAVGAHSDGPVPYPDQVYYNSTGVANTPVTKVGGFSDGVLSSLKSLLLLLLTLDQAEEVHGLVATVTK